MFPHGNEALETAQGAGLSLAAIFDSHRLHRGILVLQGSLGFSLITFRAFDYLFDYHLERYSILQQLFLLNLCAIDVVIYPC